MILAVATAAAQPPEAAIVFVTVYVPAVLAAKFIVPVAALMLNPAGEDVKAPATPPPL